MKEYILNLEKEFSLIENGFKEEEKRALSDYQSNDMLSKKVYRHVPTYIHVHSSYVECVVLLLRAD